MIEFADAFQFLFQFVIVSQPALHALLLIGPDADLLVSSPGVVDRENQSRVSLAAGAGLTTLLMPNRALEQRTTQNLGRRTDGVGQLIALADGVLVIHLHR